MGINLKETAWVRTCKESKNWLLDHILAWILAFLFPGAGTVIASCLIPSEPSVELSALYGFLGGCVGLIILLIIVYGFNFIRAPYMQRNEARQRNEELELKLNPPKPYAVVVTVEPVKLQINRFPDGSYKVKKGKTKAFSIETYEDIEVRKFDMIPNPQSLQKDGKRKFISDVMQVTPNIWHKRPLDKTWNTDDPEQWVGEGLPELLKRDKYINYPGIVLSIIDVPKIISYLENGETIQLSLSFGITTTDVGGRRAEEPHIFPVEIEVIELTGN